MRVKKKGVEAGERATSNTLAYTPRMPEGTDTQGAGHARFLESDSCADSHPLLHCEPFKDDGPLYTANAIAIRIASSLGNFSNIGF